MTRLLFIPALILAIVGSAAASEIYRTQDEDGNVVFTDEPPTDDAEAMELEPLTTVPPVDTTDAAPEASEEPEEPPGTPDNGLTGISIAYPEHESGIRHNGGTVPFRVKLEPEGATLPRGHQVEIILDGQPRGRAAGTQITVSPVDRGPHTVRARVLDNAGGARLESSSVKFYLLRKAIGGD